MNEQTYERPIYCRNCGVLMDKGKPFWEPDLCLACHHKPVIGTRYNYLTGTLLPRQTVTTLIQEQGDEPLQLLTFDEACTYLKVSRSTVYRLLKGGNLKGYKVGETGTHWRFTRAQLKGCLK